MVEGAGHFSSRAVIEKQRHDDLSPQEQALKAGFQRLQSLRDDPNAPKKELKESLEHLRHCLEQLDYWEDCLVVEQELELYTDSALELAECIFRQGKLHVQLDNLGIGNVKYQKALEMYQMEHGDIVYHADIGNVLVAMAGVDFFRENIDDCLRTLDASEYHFRKHGQTKDNEEDSDEDNDDPSRNSTTQQEPHPNLTKCLENQGMIYRIKQEFFPALEKYEEALQVVGESDLEKRQNYQIHVADMLGATNDLDGAIFYYKKIQEEDKARRSNKEEETALDGVILHSLGMLHSQQRKLDIARDELTQAVEIKRRIGGAANPEVSASLLALGSVHGVMGKKRESLECFQKALAIAKVTAGDDKNDPEVLHILRNISVLNGEKVPKWDG